MNREASTTSNTTTSNKIKINKNIQQKVKEINNSNIKKNSVVKSTLGLDEHSQKHKNTLSSNDNFLPVSTF